MSTRTAHIRFVPAVAVVVAGSIVGVAGTLALAAARPDPAPQQQERAAIAEWARTQHLAGLSPASLATLDQDPDFEAHRAAELAAIAEFAVDEGLSGLSPASLHPLGD